MRKQRVVLFLMAAVSVLAFIAISTGVYFSMAKSHKEKEFCYTQNVSNACIYTYSNEAMTKDVTRVWDQEIVTISCNYGYFLSGETNLQCVGSKWSGEFPTCQPKSCQTSGVDHGFVFYKGKPLRGSRNVSHMASIDFDCKEGFALSRRKEIVCRLGTWSDAFPRCSPSKCQTRNIYHGRVIYRTKEYGSAVTVDSGEEIYVSCAANHSLNGASRLKCLRGKWSDEFPVCQPRTCAFLNFPNGKVVYQGASIKVASGIFHDTQLHVTCDKGFTVLGRNVVNCTFGKWSHPFPSCRPKNCTIQGVANANFAVDGKAGELTLRHNESLYIRCKSGHDLEGEEKLTCLFGLWSSDFPTCKPQSCIIPSVVDGSAVSLRGLLKVSSAVHHHETVSVSCNEGFVPSNQSGLSCIFGQWSSGFPTCVPKSCLMEAVANGAVRNGQRERLFRASTVVDHSEAVTVECDVGFARVGDYQLSCSYGRWSAGFPSCNPNRCQTEDVTSGKVLKDCEEVEGGTKLDNGSKVEVTCDNGYFLSGAPHLSCFLGNWTGAFPECLPRACQTRDVANGRIHHDQISLNTSTTIRHGELVYVACNKGYSSNLTGQLRCNLGNWSSKFPVCEPKGCATGNITNGSVTYLGDPSARTVPHGGSAHFSCAEGFALSSKEKNSRCGFGKWSIDFPTCRPKWCKFSTAVDSMVILHSLKRVDVSKYVAHDEVINIFCDDGYSLTGERALTCLYGKWSAGFPLCAEKNCSSEQVKYGRVVRSGVLAPTVVPHEAEVEVLCDRGYRMRGEATRQCILGKWSTEFPTCVPSGCRMSRVKNARLSTSASKVPHGKKVTVRCNNGYEIQGASLVTCALGRWSNDFPICKESGCRMSRVKNARLSTSASKVPHGKKVTVRCNNGYEIQGASLVTCALGRWSNDFPICKESGCTMSRVKNARLSTSASQVPHGSRVTVTCKKDYEIQGASLLTCALGRWSNDFPICKESIRCPTPLALKDGWTVFGARTPGSVVEFRCFDTYELDGESSMTCLPDGRWSLSEDDYPFCYSGS